MEQEKLKELIQMIMADQRIMDLIRSSLGNTCELTLIENRTVLDCLPSESKCSIFCQETLSENDAEFLSLEDAARISWNKIRIVQPSFNLIAKLALGIADEPILKIVQDKLLAGFESIYIVGFPDLAQVKSVPYRKLFLNYKETIRTFGVEVEDNDTKKDSRDHNLMEHSETARSVSGEARIWEHKALTEKDLLDMENGVLLKVGRKCIVTSLAAEMARRKSIQICREGEGK